MKRRKLEMALRRLGWWDLREGGRHTIWTNGSESEPVPRHNEIAEVIARKILRTASQFPGAERK